MKMQKNQFFIFCNLNRKFAILESWDLKFQIFSVHIKGYNIPEN